MFSVSARVQPYGIYSRKVRCLLLVTKNQMFDFNFVSISYYVVCSDVVYHPWKKEDAGNQTREILYTISLSNPLAPKTATVTETQVQSNLKHT